MAYNLESFEHFVVSIPHTRRVLGYLLGVSLLAGALSAGALDLASQSVSPSTVAVLVTTFAIAALAGGVTTSLLVSAFPLDWGLYLSLLCLVIAGALLPVAFLLERTAAVWFALGTAVLFSFQALVISDDVIRAPRHALASVIQPALLVAGLTVATPLAMTTAHSRYVLVLLGVVVALVAVSLFAEWLMRANIGEVRAFEITSHLVTREPLHLNLGVPVTVPVQTFALDTDGRTRIVAPWVHPGVLEGIGGGRLTRNLLAALDRDDERAFFWHIPCTHRSDSADPAVHEPVLAGVTDPETVDRASRMISMEDGDTVFHGRRYGDSQVIFVESDEHGDIEVDVLGDLVDPETTLVVDRHARVETGEREQVFRESPAAASIRESFRTFRDRLADQPLADYRAGDAVDIDHDGISLHALVEEVDGQQTVCLTADQNERPYALAAVKDDLEAEFDEFLLFTTDTHASVYDNRFDPQAGPERIRAVVSEATDALTDAAAGLDASTAEVELLRSDYPRLMHTLNVLARLYIVSLAGLYVLLAVALALV